MVEHKIEELLLKKFEEEEFNDCFIVAIELNNNKLGVFVDSDSIMNFTKCKRLSRYLEEYIDEEQWLGEKYILEVSSPGIDRPLKFPRQYLKNIGRQLEVNRKEEAPISGLLKKVFDDGILMEEKLRVKEGKKKVTKMIQTKILFEDIKKAKVKISFQKK